MAQHPGQSHPMRALGSLDPRHICHVRAQRRGALLVSVCCVLLVVTVGARQTSLVPSAAAPDGSAQDAAASVAAIPGAVAQDAAASVAAAPGAVAQDAAASVAAVPDGSAQDAAASVAAVPGRVPVLHEDARVGRECAFTQGTVPASRWDARRGETTQRLRDEHECHLFGYIYADGAASEDVLAAQCSNLYDKTILQREGLRETPSRDGWGFAYFLAPPHPGIQRPIVIRSGAAASDDDLRWQAAQDEVAAHGFGGASCVVGHVRLSSYGPDNGALPDPHPFADSLMGRWWFFAHNGHMVPDTLMQWIPQEFLERHPLDYVPILVDSEVLFRYCQYEIERLGSVREGLLTAFGRVKEYHDFVFNICFTDGDTLWAAHSHTRSFYYDVLPDSSSWWASTVVEGQNPPAMENHHLYWFTGDGMGVVSYE